MSVKAGGPVIMPHCVY